MKILPTTPSNRALNLPELVCLAGVVASGVKGPRQR